MKKYLLVSFIIAIHLVQTAPAIAVDLNVFGDVTFGDSEETGEVSGFSLGQLDFWATHKIDPDGRFRTFLELVVESPGEGFIVDLERLWVEFRPASAFRVRGGRFHTSLGHWNRAFHHGTHMQTTVFRPLFLDFEDGKSAILPTHMVGLMGVADQDIGAGHFHFEFQFGNGSSFEQGGELNPGSSGDVDSEKGLAARLIFAPTFLEGLGIGSSFYLNDISLTTGGVVTSDLVDQMIYQADLTFLDQFDTNIEFIFEHYWVVNEDGAGKSETTTVWYVQLAKTFRDMATPYVRYEAFENIHDDPYFRALGFTGPGATKSEYTQVVYGARFDFDIAIGAATSVKVEGRTTDEPGKGSINSYWLQWTFGF